MGRRLDFFDLDNNLIEEDKVLVDDDFRGTPMLTRFS
jgi:hypothetical protein